MDPETQVLTQQDAEATTGASGTDQQQATAPAARTYTQDEYDQALNRRNQENANWLLRTPEGRTWVLHHRDVFKFTPEELGLTPPPADTPTPKTEVERLREQIAELRKWRDGITETQQSQRQQAIFDRDVVLACDSIPWGKDPDTRPLVIDLIRAARYDADSEGIATVELAKGVQAGLDALLNKLVDRRLKARSEAARRQPFTGGAAAGSVGKPRQDLTGEAAEREMLRILEESGGIAVG